MEEIYGILNYMTGDNLFTHQLPRAARACEGPLRDQFPELDNIEPPEVGSFEDCHRFLDSLGATHGATKIVKPLPPYAYIHQDPLSELEDMVPKDRIVAVYDIKVD